jgi:hypothetical protein
MDPPMTLRPISVLLGLGLLVGKLSLIETFFMGSTEAGRIGDVVGLVMKLSRGRELRPVIELVMTSTNC